MPKQEEPVIGKAAIGEYYKKLVADPHYAVHGDVRIEQLPRGRRHRDRHSGFRWQLTRDGKQIHFHGKILIVWKKQKDGSWKIFRYMFDEIPAKKPSTSH